MATLAALESNINSHIPLSSWATAQCIKVVQLV